MADRPAPRKQRNVGHSTFLSLKADLESLKRPSSSSSSSHGVEGRSSASASRSTGSFGGEARRSKLSSTFLDVASHSSKRDCATSSRRKRDNDDDEQRRRSSRKRVTSEWASTPSAQLDAIRANLERKARVYDRLSRGLHAGVDEEELKSGVVDWDAKAAATAAADEDADRHGGAHGERDEEASNDGWDDEQGDEEIEYIDDLGRTRRARKRDVPREFLPASLGGRAPDPPGADDGEDDDGAIYGPATQFPVYRAPSPEMAARRAKLAAQPPAEKHFDADWETRHRGAAFYRFAGDEAERQRQMRNLREVREETERRRWSGGVDDDEGQQEPRQHGELDSGRDTEAAQRREGKGRAKRRETMAARQAAVENERLAVLGAEAVEARRQRIQSERLMALLPPSVGGASVV